MKYIEALRIINAMKLARVVSERIEKKCRRRAPWDVGKPPDDVDPNCEHCYRKELESIESLHSEHNSFQKAQRYIDAWGAAPRTEHSRHRSSWAPRRSPGAPLKLKRLFRTSSPPSTRPQSKKGLPFSAFGG